MPNTNDPTHPSKIENNRLAVVTGASGGLGGEFARQLAASGYHLVLTARREERMQALAAELRQLYGIQVQVLPADLANIDELRGLEDALRKMERIDLLINNAGFGLMGHFWQLDLQAQADMLQVHDLASMRLTHAVLPNMIDSQGRWCGSGILHGCVSTPAQLRHVQCHEIFFGSFQPGINR